MSTVLGFRNMSGNLRTWDWRLVAIELAYCMLLNLALEIVMATELGARNRSAD
jgi:hypothetical protein